MRSQLLPVAMLTWAALSASVQAEAPAYPLLEVNDSWKYTAAVESGGVRKELGTANVSVEYKTVQGAFAISNRDPKIAGDKQIADISHVIKTDLCMVDLLQQIPILGGEHCAKSLRKGQKWRREFKGDTSEVTLEFRFVGIRNIKVPAGDFSALVIECENTVKSAKGTFRMSREFWYSPAAHGLVFMSNQEYDAAGKPDDKYTYGLVAFTGH